MWQGVLSRYIVDLADDVANYSLYVTLPDVVQTILARQMEYTAQKRLYKILIDLARQIIIV